MFDADQGESVGFCVTRLFANRRSCSVNSAAVSFALEYGSYGSAGCREPSSRSSSTPGVFAVSVCACARMSCASCQAIVSVFVYGNIASSDLGDVCTGELCEHQHAHAGSCARGACMRRRARRRAYIARGYICLARGPALEIMMTYQSRSSTYGSANNRPQFRSKEQAMTRKEEPAKTPFVDPDLSFAAASLSEAFASLSI